MKRNSIFIFSLLLVSLYLSSCNNDKTDRGSKDYYLFTGTYSPADSTGISVFKFDSETGESSFISGVSGIENPSYLALSPDHKNLYAVSETHHNRDGEVFAYQFDKDKGELSYINRTSVAGDDPCYIITDSLDNTLFVANYTSGSLAVLPIQKNGSVGKLEQLIDHKGQGPVSPNQDSAHVHTTVMASNNEDLFVTDLGTDQIFRYTYNNQTETLQNNPDTTATTAGAGPRLMEFSSDENYLYVIHELGGQLTVYQQDSGSLSKIQEISNLPEGYNGEFPEASDIHLSPDGKFLYTTNRDELNDIVTYEVNEENGKVNEIDRQSTHGKTPRKFIISPDGRFILVGHQNSADITVFKRDEKTGQLRLTPKSIHVPHTVDLKMMPL